MAYDDCIIEYVETKVAPDGTIQLGCITYKDAERRASRLYEDTVRKYKGYYGTERKA